ncbi:MAG: STAS domain-containing protein [Calditrichaeota bacterium]|nr:STAS domain-containing protein [Calditrichota bacterium]
MLSSKRQGDVVLVSFTGTNALDINSVEAFREQMTRLLAGARTVVLDMQNVDFVDSAGLRALIWLRRELTRKGRRLILYRLRPSVRDVLEVTRLIRIFATCSDPSELRRMLTQGAKTEAAADRAKLQTIIYPNGAILQVEDSDTLNQDDARSVVRQAGSLARPGRPVILDLRNVQYVDAAALWLLTDALRRAKEAKSALYVLVNSETLKQIFENVPAWRGYVIHSEHDLPGLVSGKKESANEGKEKFVDLGLMLGATGT